METNKLLDEGRQGEVLMMQGRAEQGSRKLFLESYGCQMNFSDSEIVASVLASEGFTTTDNYREADLVLINTCSIRENAEQKVRHRLQEFNAAKKRKPGLIIGVMGCMAERLKSKFLEEEKMLDIVVGPDAYRDLPGLIRQVEGGQKAVNVLLSREETYADISPVRLDSNGVSAFISIMRGCDNMCSFCVVPFTRGRERSRDPHSVVQEAKELMREGYREVTLLGQNVDSYIWAGGGLKKDLSDEQKAGAVDFAGLLEMVASISPQLRVRFSTSHPKDITDKVLETMAAHDNICRYIHLPVQSGSTAMLERMNRGYSREWYLSRVKRIRQIMPDCEISTDIITGFCGETEDDHRQTLSLMAEAGFSYAFMFAYSERPGTPAEKHMKDDVPEETKLRRLREVVALQQQHSAARTKEAVGKSHRVLIEGPSRRSENMWSGRNSQNNVVVFPKGKSGKGEYAEVMVEDCTSATLIGKEILSY
ncbi:MAG: tRNA (N6-isopentenyl adenosine(37)-C2)-methylthiotransferase MiaB [Bacteroidia bacterium]|nr:tRNA (N6-isopentenyl adenosine(37)-C2)-methylthiotransferase MiaB [Bacteroidia bacterium]